MSEIKSKSWNNLYEKYPNLFVNRSKTPMESCMSFGVECNLGWYEILSNLCYEISQHENNITNEKNKNRFNENYSPVVFDQIKEKFGGLRVYYSGGDEFVEGLVNMAEAISYCICENCGDQGKPNKQGWITTLCDKCKTI
jgi:hypothetical protein